MTEKTSPSRQSAQKTIFAVFKILKEAGGSLPGKEVIDRVKTSVQFTQWEQEIYEKTGYIRWQSIMHFFTIDCIKAGFLTKSKGVWYLTEEGDKALELGPEKLLENATTAYKKWAAERDKAAPAEEDVDNEQQIQKANLEQIEERAINEIYQFIINKNPYEFQELVAALLRAMDYFTPYIAPKGRDGGIDIIAYRDPLGASMPRIKVQVKHRPDAAVPPEDIRKLIGLLNKDGDVGLFVTSGRFTSESERQARNSHIHIKLIDGETLVSLWQEFYPKLSDDEKYLLPLHRIYFLGSLD